MRDDRIGWCVDVYDPSELWWVGTHRGPFKTVGDAIAFVSNLVRLARN